MSRRLGAIGLGVLAASLATVAGVRVQGARARARARAEVAAALPAVRADGFVGSSACAASCHPAAYASWHATYHRTMTQPASEASVLGRFDGRALADGIHPEHDDDGFWFREGDTRRRVVMTTGSHHMQVYWHAAADGTLQAARWAWLREPSGGRFVPNEATLLRPPSDPSGFTWNRVCIKCHAVAGRPGWDAATATVSSTAAELGIACEACHGPGAEHVARHRDPFERWRAHGDDAPDPTIVHPGRLAAAQAGEVCEQCHAITVFADEDDWIAHGRMHPIGAPASHPPVASWGHLARHPIRDDRPEAEIEAWVDPLLDADPEFFVDRFWSDGMVRVSGREYNGMVESPCFASGELSCLTCHSMHDAPADDQLRPAARTDEVCATCHAREASAAEAHGRHDPSRVGCMDCHMPYTTWGLLKAIRSHEIDVPRASVAAQTGRPLACALCHLDRSAAWSAEALARGWGHEVPEGLEDATPASIAGALAGDAGQRALWAWHLGWDRATGRGPWIAEVLGELLDDPYLAVRISAEHALERGGLPTPAIDPLDDGRAARDDVIQRTSRTLDRDMIEAWLRRRDDRPVRLAE